MRQYSRATKINVLAELSTKVFEQLVNSASMPEERWLLLAGAASNREFKSMSDLGKYFAERIYFSYIEPKPGPFIFPMELTDEDIIGAKSNQQEETNSHE